jgi:hypothetical protein
MADTENETYQKTYGDFPCDECPRVFKLQGYLKRHKRNVHRKSTQHLPAKINGNITGPEFSRLEGFILLKDNKGQVWLAERIK